MDLNGIIWSQEDFTANELLLSFHDKTPFIVGLLRQHQHQQRELCDILRVAKFVKQLRVNATDATDNSKAYSLPVKECNLVFKVRHKSFRFLGGGYLTLEKLINKYPPPVLVEYTTTTTHSKQQQQQQQQHEAQCPLTTGTLTVGKSGIENFMVFNYIDADCVISDRVEYLSASKTDDKVRYLMAQGMYSGGQKWIALNELCNRKCQHIKYNELTGPVDVFEVTPTATTTQVTSNNNAATAQQQQQQQHRFLSSDDDQDNQHSQVSAASAAGITGVTGVGEVRRKLDYETNIDRTGLEQRRYTLERFPNSTHSRKPTAAMEFRNDVTTASLNQRVGRSQDNLMANRQVRRTGDNTKQRDTGVEQWETGSQIAGRVEEDGRMEHMDTIHSGKMNKDFKTRPVSDWKRVVEIQDRLDDGSVAETDSVDVEVRQMMMKYVDENDNQLLAVNNNNYDDTKDELGTESQTTYVKDEQDVEQDNDTTSEQPDVVEWNDDVESNLVRMRHLSLSIDDIPRTVINNGHTTPQLVVTTTPAIAAIRTTDVSVQLDKSVGQTTRQSQQPLTSPAAAAAATSEPATFTINKHNSTLSHDIVNVTSQHHDVLLPVTYHGTLAIGRPTNHQRTLYRHPNIQQSASFPLSALTTQFPQQHQSRDTPQFSTIPAVNVSGPTDNNSSLPTPPVFPTPLNIPQSPPETFKTSVVYCGDEGNDVTGDHLTMDHIHSSVVLVGPEMTSHTRPEWQSRDTMLPSGGVFPHRSTIIVRDTENGRTQSRDSDYHQQQRRVRAVQSTPGDNNNYNDIQQHHSRLSSSSPAAERRRSADNELDSEWVITSPRQRQEVERIAVRTGKITVTTGTTGTRRSSVEARTVRSVVYDDEDEEDGRNAEWTVGPTGRDYRTTQQLQQQQQQRQPRAIKSLHQDHNSTSRDQVHSSMRNRMTSVNTRHNQQIDSAGPRLVYSQSRDVPDTLVNDVSSHTRPRRQNRVTFDNDTADVIKHGVNSTSGSRRHNDQMTSYPVSAREPVQLVRTRSDRRPQLLQVDPPRGVFTDNMDTSKIGRKQVVHRQAQWTNQPLRIDIDHRMTSSRPIIVSPPSSDLPVTSRTADSRVQSRRNDIIYRETSTRFHHR